MMNEVPTGTSAEIGGLAANDTTLYAANTARDRIEVYDAESMQQKNNLDRARAGPYRVSA